MKRFNFFLQVGILYLIFCCSAVSSANGFISVRDHFGVITSQIESSVEEIGSKVGWRLFLKTEQMKLSQYLTGESVHLISVYPETPMLKLIQSKIKSLDSQKQANNEMLTNDELSIKSQKEIIFDLIVYTNPSDELAEIAAELYFDKLKVSSKQILEFEKTDQATLGEDLSTHRTKILFKDITGSDWEKTKYLELFLTIGRENFNFRWKTK